MLVQKTTCPSIHRADSHCRSSGPHEISRRVPDTTACSLPCLLGAESRAVSASASHYARNWPTRERLKFDGVPLRGTSSRLTNNSRLLLSSCAGFPAKRLAGAVALGSRTEGWIQGRQRALLSPTLLLHMHSANLHRTGIVAAQASFSGINAPC